MAGLTDIDGFIICIQDCVLSGFLPLLMKAVICAVACPRTRDIRTTLCQILSIYLTNLSDELTFHRFNTFSLWSIKSTVSHLTPV